MSKAKNRPEVDTLLSERARFELWLEQLAAKSASMPAHVVARVRGDYEERLNKVVEELQSRADELRSDAESLDERIAKLDSELTAKRDARAEDELRALVGEYEDHVWNDRAAAHDSGIQTLEAERGECEGERTRLLAMLAEATRPSQAQAEPVVEEAPPVEEPEPTDPELPPSRESAPTAKRPSPFDEIGFLRTVVGRTTPFPGLGASQSDIEVDAAMSELREPTPTPVPSKPAVPEPEPAARTSARTSIPTFEPPSVTEPARSSRASVPSMEAEPAAAPTPDVGRRSGGMDAARSLKCQECGSMNYPTEWYCEKCGGELAAF